MKRLVCAAILVYGCVLAVFAQQAPAGDRFYQAIRANDLVGLRKLVTELGVNAEDASGMTPLTLAAAFGTREAVSALLDAGADVKAQSRSGVTALHVAWQDASVVRLLLDRGADVNAKTQLGATPLQVAASANGTEAVVSLLLEKGAEPDAAETRGVTPLIAAATAATPRWQSSYSSTAPMRTRTRQEKARRRRRRSWAPRSTATRSSRVCCWRAKRMSTPCPRTTMASSRTARSCLVS